jgi:hypothetical protein
LRPEIRDAIDAFSFQLPGSEQVIHGFPRIAPTSISGNDRSQVPLRRRSEDSGNDEDQFAKPFLRSRFTIEGLRRFVDSDASFSPSDTEKPSMVQAL